MSEISVSDKPSRGKKTVSPRQLAANRANAKKSTGPVSPEGKAASRFNRLRHGLTAAIVVVPGESREVYNERLAQYLELYQPQTIAEHDAVEDLVVARWRRRRAVSYESAVFHEHFMQRRVNVHAGYATLSLDVEAALSFKDLADKDARLLELLDRYDLRTMHAIVQATRRLDDLQSRRPPASPSAPPIDLGEFPETDDAPTEPIPINEQSPDPAPEPVGGAHAPRTIVLREEPPASGAPAPRTFAAAGASSAPATEAAAIRSPAASVPVLYTTCGYHST